MYVYVKCNHSCQKMLLLDQIVYLMPNIFWININSKFSNENIARAENSNNKDNGKRTSLTRKQQIWDHINVQIMSNQCQSINVESISSFRREFPFKPTWQNYVTRALSRHSSEASWVLIHMILDIMSAYAT